MTAKKHRNLNGTEMTQEQMRAEIQKKLASLKVAIGYQQSKKTTQSVESSKSD